jgi:hypothetical protein
VPQPRYAQCIHIYCGVPWLWENGAEIDALDIGDNTALHWAAMRGHVEIVNYLLQAGRCDVLSRTNAVPVHGHIRSCAVVALYCRTYGHD